MSLVDILRDWVFDPLAFMFLAAILLLLIFCRSKYACAAGLVWLLFVLLVSAPKIVNPMLLLFEDDFSAEPACLAERPIVVLGGGVDSRVARAAEFERMSAATSARVARGLSLAQQYLNAKLIVTGGAVLEVSEAAVMQHFLVRTGVNQERILSDGQSRNTFENAVNVASLLSEHELPQHVNLVSSALHMRRAKAVFEQQGIQVCPVAVNKIGLKDLPFYAWMPQTTALEKFDKLLHEWLAIILYRWKGQI